MSQWPYRLCRYTKKLLSYTKFQSSAYTPATATQPFGIHHESGGTSGATIVLLLSPKNFGKPLEGFRERCRRFRRKIIHLTANTYVCIATYILKRWHIHAGVLAHTCGSVFLVMSFECLFFPYKRWITQVVSSGCVSSLIGLREYSHMVS